MVDESIANADKRKLTAEFKAYVERLDTAA